MKILVRIFYVILICIFLLFCIVQGYFFLNPQLQDDRRAQRLGATLKETATNVENVGKEESGLFIFLTFETKKGIVSDCSILVNDEAMGDFRAGILSIKAHPHDKIYLSGGKKGDEIHLMDYPSNLDNSQFPASLNASGEKIFWGTIELR